MRRASQNILVILFCLPMLAGCAEMTAKTYRPKKSVTVKYSQGWFMADKNRSKAIEMANEFCSPGRAVLLAEDNKREFTGHSTTYQRTDRNITTGDVTQDQSSNVYLHFACGKATAQNN